MARALTTALCAGVLLAAPATASASGSVIVKYKAGAAAKARTAAADRAGVGGVLGSVAANGARVVHVAGDPSQTAATLNRSATVDYAEPNVTLHATGIPNDPLFSQLYALTNMQAPAGWDLGGYPNLPGITVGVVDTGIDATHEDLAGKVAVCASTDPLTDAVRDGSCADDNDHGTHVSGTIAARANNGVGIAGVSFNSDIAMCKALDALGTGTTAGVANCITYLTDKGVKVISMSLGGGGSDTLQSAVTNATNKGALLIAAAGNDGNATVEYPAGYPEVVSVAATDANDQHASFSDANDKVEISAAGVDVLSCKRGGGYEALSGTSMATPHVAGVAALIRARNPTFTVAQARAKLDASVDDEGTPGRDPQFGFGRVDLVKAMTP